MPTAGGRARLGLLVPLRVASISALFLAVLVVPLAGGTLSPPRAVAFAKAYSWGTFDKTSFSDSTTPQRISAVPSTIVQISASNSDTYVLTAAGTVWAWGNEDYGALGNGTHKAVLEKAPVKVDFPSGVKIASLASPMPFNTGMAIDTDGDVWGWGYGGEALCEANVASHYVPKELAPSKLRGDVTLATGAFDHSLFYTASGALYACGGNTSGELGDRSFTSSDNPVKVAGLPAGQVVSLQSSWKDSGALMSNGTYWDWGYNAAGQLGDGTKKASDVPVEVTLPARVDTVALGGSLPGNGQSVAILSDGSVYSWGNDSDGQLGTGTHKPSVSHPQQAAVPSGTTFVSVASGGASEYAIDASGELWAWGSDSEGQLGIGNTTNETAPVAVGITVKQVSSTAFNVAGLA